jgi:hypothetical protein
MSELAQDLRERARVRARESTLQLRMEVAECKDGCVGRSVSPKDVMLTGDRSAAIDAGVSPKLYRQITEEWFRRPFSSGRLRCPSDLAGPALLC